MGFTNAIALPARLNYIHEILPTYQKGEGINLRYFAYHFALYSSPFSIIPDIKFTAFVNAFSVKA
jgi:hypothetical protein